MSDEYFSPLFWSILLISTVFASYHFVAFVKTKYANASDDVPDIEFHFVSGSTNSDGGNQLRKAHGLTQKFYDAVFSPYNNRDTWSILPMLLRPKSVGSIRLRSRNPFDYPYIYPNYFADDADIKTLVEGVKIAGKFSQFFKSILRDVQKLACSQLFKEMVFRIGEKRGRKIKKKRL